MLQRLTKFSSLIHLNCLHLSCQSLHTSRSSTSVLVTLARSSLINRPHQRTVDLSSIVVASPRVGILKMSTGVPEPLPENVASTTEELKVSTCDTNTNSTEKSDDKPRPEYQWKRAKKVAVMLSFSGKEYFGMQRNPGMSTIEEELMVAMRKAGAIDPDWVDNPQKAFFQRASRTDKGVSAAKMICSLKMLDDPETVSRINENLPVDIKIQSVVRVTKNFNCKSAADARTYLYLTPTFAFSPATEIVTEGWRCEEDTIDNVNSVLKHFIGVHYFHNYTSGKLPMEPSAQRYIHEFECGKPFIRDGLEFCVIRVKGQSFMLHQIRKMLGLTFAIVRGHTDLKTVEQSWGMERIDIPRAPGLGLLLDEIHYDRYNKRYGDDGIHQPLSWESVQDSVDRFKEDFIFSDIVATEVKSKSMLEWMAVLPMHKFEPRHFENDNRARSPLFKALRNVGKEDASGASEDYEDDKNGGKGTDTGKENGGNLADSEDKNGKILADNDDKNCGKLADNDIQSETVSNPAVVTS